MKRPAGLSVLARFSTLFGGRIGGAVAMFLINLIIARHFGAEALGIFAVFVAAVGIVCVCLPVGFNGVATLFAAEYASTDRRGALNGYIRTAARYGGSMALAMAGLGAVLVFAVPDRLPPNGAAFVTLVWLTAVAIAAMGMLGALLVGLKKQVAGMLPETFLRPGLLLACVVLAVVFGWTDGIDLVLLFYAGTAWVALAVAGVLAFGVLRETLDTPPVYQTVRWRKAAYPWMAISLSWDFLVDVLILLAGLLAGSAEVALLHVCFRFRILVGYAMRSIIMLWIPDIAAAKAQNDLEAMTRRLAEANVLSVAFSIAVLGGFALLGPLLLGLFGEELAHGVPVLLAASTTLFLRAVFGPAPSILALYDLHNRTAALMIGGLVLALVLAATLYPVFGVLGIAIAYSASNGVVSFLLWRYTKAQTGIDCSVFGGFSALRTMARLRRAENPIPPAPHG